MTKLNTNGDDKGSELLQKAKKWKKVHVTAMPWSKPQWRRIGYEKHHFEIGLYLIESVCWNVSWVLSLRHELWGFCNRRVSNIRVKKAIYVLRWSGSHATAAFRYHFLQVVVKLFVTSILIAATLPITYRQPGTQLLSNVGKHIPLSY